MSLLAAWFTNIRWTDLLDIGLLWYVVYRGLMLVRGTRAFQSLLGLLVALVLYVASGRLELFAVHWMLEKFLVYIVLAVIILFQSDIKRGLAKRLREDGFASVAEAVGVDTSFKKTKKN